MFEPKYPFSPIICLFFATPVPSIAMDLDRYDSEDDAEAFVEVVLLKVDEVVVEDDVNPSELEEEEVILDKLIELSLE